MPSQIHGFPNEQMYEHTLLDLLSVTCVTVFMTDPLVLANQLRAHPWGRLSFHLLLTTHCALRCRSMVLGLALALSAGTSLSISALGWAGWAGFPGPVPKPAAGLSGSPYQHYWVEI